MKNGIKEMNSAIAMMANGFKIITGATSMVSKKEKEINIELIEKIKETLDNFDKRTSYLYNYLPALKELAIITEGFETKINLDDREYKIFMFDNKINHSPSDGRGIYINIGKSKDEEKRAFEKYIPLGNYKTHFYKSYKNFIFHSSFGFNNENKKDYIEDLRILIQNFGEIEAALVKNIEDTIFLKMEKNKNKMEEEIHFLKEMEEFDAFCK